MKYILYGIIFIYLFRKLFGFVARYYLTKFVNKQTQQFKSNQKPKYPEGHIHVDINPKKPTSKTNKKSDEGDFADFEVIN